MQTVGYDPRTGTLEDNIKSGAVYQYYDFPGHVHAELMTASSHGKYLDAHVKERGYRYRRV